MNDRLSKEVDKLVPCRCHEDYTSRKRHEPRWPGGNCDDVRDVAERAYSAGFRAALERAVKQIRDFRAECDCIGFGEMHESYCATKHNAYIKEQYVEAIRALAEGEKRNG